MAEESHASGGRQGEDSKGESSRSSGAIGSCFALRAHMGCCEEPGQGSGDKGKVPSPSGHQCTRLGNRKLGVSARSQNERRQEAAGPRVAVDKDSVLVHLGLLSHQCHPREFCGACSSFHGSCLPSTPISSDFPLEKVPFLLSAPGSISLAPGTPDVALSPPSTAGTSSVKGPRATKPMLSLQTLNGSTLFPQKSQVGLMETGGGGGTAS